MILDHISIAVRDFGRSSSFFRRALAPLGVETILEGDGWAMLGKEGKPEFWFGLHGLPPGPIHVAFAAQNRQQVREFHRAALAAGGRDNGAPGIRAKYHPNYYGAFVFDPDGNNIEAVCHQPEPAP
jgi:catechol 2,3-dioxygenase-like lactoylglutathione lyase family enzyme